MEQKKWFAFVDGIVHGPFDRTQLESRLSSWNHPLIWGRGQKEWVEPTHWTEELYKVEEVLQDTQVTVGQMWRVRNSDQETKPLSQEQMMSYLKTLHDFSEVQLWTEGYTEWKDIFQIHKIMDELGVSRRSHPRVPIMGTVTCEKTGFQVQVRLQSISEGGLGVVEAKPLKIGDQLRCTMKSPNLVGQFSFTAEVVFASPDGYAGLKFLNLPTETKSLIIEYVSKFQNIKQATKA